MAPSEHHPLPPGGGENTSLIVAPSLIPRAGLGCFADRDYQDGEVVGHYTGEVLGVFQMLRTRDWTYLMGLGKTDNGRRIWVDTKMYLSIKERYINHHFDPSKWNLRLELRPNEAKCILTASRHIRKGEELYFDYGEKYWHIVSNTQISPNQQHKRWDTILQ